MSVRRCRRTQIGLGLKKTAQTRASRDSSGGSVSGGAVKAEPGCAVWLSEQGAVSLLHSSHTDWRDVAPFTADL